MESLRTELEREKMKQISQLQQKHASEVQALQQDMSKLEKRNEESQAQIHDLLRKRAAAADKYAELEAQSQAQKVVHAGEINRLQEEIRQGDEHQNFLSLKVAAHQEKVAGTFLRETV